MSNTRVIKQDVRRQEKIRHRKVLRRRRLQRRKNVMIVILAVCAVLFIINGVIGNDGKKENDKKSVRAVKKDKDSENDFRGNSDDNKSDKNAAGQGNDDGQIIVNPPKERNLDEILSRLEIMSNDNETIAQIYENYEDYPENILGLLVNNPETLEFVSGYPQRNKIEKIDSQEEQQFEQYPLLMQWDQRWGYEEYGDSIIGLAGCGPTCLSMVINSLTYNYDITPDVVADFSEKNGHYVNGTGTSWSLMTEGAEEYGLNVTDIVLDEVAIKENLDNGKIVIAAVGPGDFTAKGHFIVIYGYDEEGFYVNDPNCKYRSNISWSYEELSGQIKMLWSYWING